MTVSRLKLLYALNAHLAHQALAVYDAPSDTYKPYSGSAQVRFSAAADGSTTIAGAGPFAMVASSVPGIYYLIISPTIIATIVAAVPAGGTAYQVVESTPESPSNLTDIQPFLVTAGRAPQ